MADSKPQAKPQSQPKPSHGFKNTSPRESQQDKDKRLGVDQSKEKRHFPCKKDLSKEEVSQIEKQGGGSLKSQPKKPVEPPTSPPVPPVEPPDEAAKGPAHP